MLAGMSYPEYPVALGIIRAVETQTYDGAMIAQHVAIQAKSKIKCVDDLLREGSTWEV
jgi:2-oxoglutarate ferredoxin oxidoreductase subunit beta